MSQAYPVPLAEVRVELLVANSRFIATLAPVFDVEAARTFIQRVKAEFPDATHNVPAYIIVAGGIQHCSDDGEPSGTAGRPALAVLQGSGLGDVAVVVTRYFGGTKLGAGGLVRAYSEAVRLALAGVQRAVRTPTETLLLSAPYSLLERLRRLVLAQRGQVLSEEFAADVTLTLRFPVEAVPAFQSALTELSSGTLAAISVERGQTLLPLPASEAK